MIDITSTISLDESELQFSFIRSPGPGGQNVNKVATAVLLRFNLKNSALPEDVRQRALILFGSRLTQLGELIIKASSHRTQERNKMDAIARLVALLKRAALPPKKRKKTKPSYSSSQKRLNEKKLHGKNKTLRRAKFSSDS